MNSVDNTNKIEDLQKKQRKQLITIHRKYSLMNKEYKQQVQNHLLNQLDYLLGRKEVDLMRKRKIKEVEESCEKLRISRISKMNEKLSRSDKNRAQTLRKIKSRSKKNLQYFDQKIKKKADQDQQNFKKMLEAQKEFIRKTSTSRISKKSFNRSSSNLENSRSFNQKLHKTQLQRSIDTIDSKIALIQSQIDQAKTNQQIYNMHKSQRAKGFFKNVNERLEQIQSNSNRQQAKRIQQYYGRTKHIIDCQQRSKSIYERQSQRRKKDIDQRFKKCNQNLKYLSNQRQNRLQKLSNKLNSITFAPKTWRNEKDEIYLQKFITNLKKIKQDHVIKADNIINKHFNLSMKNRALRQKKDRIFQAIRK